MRVFLIELPVFLLLIGKGKQNLIISIALYFLICSAAIFLERGRKRISLAVRYPFPTILICLALAVFFFHNWSTSGRLEMLSSFLNKPPRQSCIIIALFLSLLAVIGIDYLLKLVMDLLGRFTDTGDYNCPEIQIRLYIFLTAFLTVTLNSRCSPVYPFNDWIDPNTMFTVGKSVLKGYVPYRDLYEHKGPLLLFLHTIGAAISFKSFLGMWILEILFCFAFLTIAYKTVRLYYSGDIFVFIPFLAFAVYSSGALQAGDSAEEFALPFLAYALYTAVKSIKTGVSLTNKDYLKIGITAACIFWSKYSLIGFYLGWYLVMLFISVKEKKFLQLLQGTGWIFTGVLITTIPIVIYFGVNSSLSYWMRCYFYDNLFTYGKSDLSVTEKISSGLYNIITSNGIVFILFLAGLLWTVIHRQWKILSLLLVTFIVLFSTVYSIGRFYPYYSLIFSIFGTFGLYPAGSCIARHPLKQVSTSFCLMLIFCLFGVSLRSENLPFLEYQKEDLMQYKMKEVIDQSGIKNPTLFYYMKNDVGVTTVTGIIPNIRYFSYYNNPGLTELRVEQENCLRDGCSDFVIVRSASTEVYPEFEKYDHLGSFVGRVDNGLINFHYYMRKQE